MSVGCQGGEIEYNLTVDTTKVLRDIQILTGFFDSYARLLRKLGLPEEQAELLREIQRTIALLNQLRLTLIAVQAASGPIGWALAGIGAATFLIDTVEFGLDL